MRYRITIGINHYWLTEEEKDFYLGAIGAGHEFVTLKSGKILSSKFLDIVPESALNDNLKIESGQWQCGFGNWHYNGNSCGCKDFASVDLALLPEEDFERITFSEPKKIEKMTPEQEKERRAFLIQQAKELEGR